MPSVSGKVLFNILNYDPTSGIGVSGVQVALINNINGKGLIIDTDNYGYYQFDNVEEGSYSIVECFGSPSIGTTPGDFSLANKVLDIKPRDPEVKNIKEIIEDANAVQSLSRNVITPVNVSDKNIINEDFFDGPVANIYENITNIKSIGNNLITVLENGTWGSFLKGTIVATQPAEEQYGDIVKDYKFVQANPSAPTYGCYSVVNINNFSQFSAAWWNTADHTSRDETGSFAIINGAEPDSIIFTQTLSSIKPKTYYKFSFWAMNLSNAGIIPSLGIKVLTLNGDTLFNETFDNLPITKIPTWMELVKIFKIEDETSIVIQLYSNAEIGIGNDYAIDDITFYEIEIDNIIKSSQSVDKYSASRGEVLTYRVILENTGDTQVDKLVYNNKLQQGLILDKDSITINGNIISDVDINIDATGFTINIPSNIKANEVLTLAFKVCVDINFKDNYIINSANISYTFNLTKDKRLILQSINTDEVSTFVNYFELRTKIQSDMSYVTLGDTITYTISMKNKGIPLARDICLIDTIPDGTVFINGSFSLDNNIIDGIELDRLEGVNIGELASGETTTISFKVLVTSIPNNNKIENSATLNYHYPVSIEKFSTKYESTNTDVVTSSFSESLLLSTKLVDKLYANVGEVVTFTVPIINSCNNTALNIELVDSLPNEISYVSDSLRQDDILVEGISNLNRVELPKDINPLGISTITYKVIVNTIPSPNPIRSTSTTTANYVIDPNIDTFRVVKVSSHTNSVNIKVNHASLGNIQKLVDRNFATFGDTIVNTIILPNTGNVTAVSVTLNDKIPKGQMFVDGTLKINEVVTEDTPTFIKIGDIGPGQVTTITYLTKVNY